MIICFLLLLCQSIDVSNERGFICLDRIRFHFEYKTMLMKFNRRTIECVQILYDDDDDHHDKDEDEDEDDDDLTK